MNAIEMIKGRRSVRQYKNQKVSRELMGEIVGLPEGETVASIITYGFENGYHAKPTARHEVKDIMRIAGE